MARKPKDYANSKVYVIRNTVNDKVYVGSTTQPLSKRMAQHRSNMNATKNYNIKIYQKMREVGVDKFYIELLELCPCNTQEELN
jgi:group I intron endonuclease